MTTYSNTYDATDKTQAAFLAALQKGENASGNPFLGVGGTDLKNAPTDANGFPVWAGVISSDGRPSHAAGLYQFQPGTWSGLASDLGLNFKSSADQNAAAWDLAVHNYAAANGGASLEDALASGNYGNVASSLKSTWTSINSDRLSTALGNGATPITTGTGGSAPTGTASSSGSGSSGTIAQIEQKITNLFVRGGVFFLGFILIIFGLYFLGDKATGGALSDTAKGAAKAAAIA